MSEPKRYTVADIRRSYSRDKAWQELTGELPVYLFYRPVSFTLSDWALRIGLPALVITWAGLGVSIAVLVAALSGGSYAHLWVAGLGIAYHVLDCVDGNVARTTGTTTHFGAILDGFADSVFFAALLLALGLLVEHEAAHAWSSLGVEASLCVTLLVLLNRKVRDHYTLLTGTRPVLSDPPVERPSARQWALYSVTGLETLYAPALGVAGTVDASWIVLLSAAGYTVLVSCAAVGLTLAAARQRDRA